MCRKTIYHNTYGDGSQDVTERVDTCRPGMMCSRPERREYHRQFKFTKLGGVLSPETPATLADRRPTPYATATDFLELPPTPRSKSPSPSRRHESGVYVNGERVAPIHAPPRKDKRRNHVVVHAPEPPSPLRAPAIARRSTMPADYVVMETKAASGRGRGQTRHGRHHGSRRTSSREAPVARARLLDDAFAASGGSHYSSSPSRRSASPPRPPHYREHARTPLGYEFLDSERAERRRSRRSAADGGRRSSSYYRANTGGDDDFYPTPAASPQQPAAAARKEVHFTPNAADPVRESIRQQNERIARRPKLHQEVKGILKKDVSGAAAAAAAAAGKKDEYDELRRAVGQMDIHPSSSSPQQHPGLRRELSDPQYWDRLRGRFEEPRERRRRSRVYYPGEGFYKYM